MREESMLSDMLTGGCPHGAPGAASMEVEKDEESELDVCIGTTEMSRPTTKTEVKNGMALHRWAREDEDA
ncbi:hypothetical protein MTO96_044995 [Rhipicephalus appendiculatus]